MAYVDPKTVQAPKNRVRRVQVIHDEGPRRGHGSWSAALLDWDDKTDVLALRWNGGEESPIGNPQSRGKPTWFIVPNELAESIRERVEEMAESQGGGLLAGYRAMAEDREREKEAHEWSEALIGDAAGEER